MLLLHSDAQVELLASGKETILGKDIVITGLPKLEGSGTESSFHRTSVSIHEAPTEEPPTVLTVSDSLMILDLSLYGGTLSVDKEVMAAMYGPGVDPLDVLRGKVEVPDNLRSAMGAITYGVRDLTTHR
ncbi:hypothetical protein TSOC_001338 [Tetrabaena socialis]|uniref:Ysc84 actin-binding domain-containing protein n=1 Tax=Tetrabaena socialis TaxID=47790 RepID=A0A2J8AGY9_9CHLO|nr:hypothetical protein TSOC_001338 [Tetrabaena socialis]|eukprot:PNH11777.1 hypothetical protein TSOC_001338 [Tetrabaena socialis]